MNELQGSQLEPPKLAPTVFERVGVRHMVGWMLATFPLVVLLDLFTKSYLLESVWVYVWVYGVPAVWYTLRAKKKGLDLKKFWGRLPQNARWLVYPLLNIPVFMLSLGSIIVIYSLLANAAPHFVEELLSRPANEAEGLAASPVLVTLLELFGSLVLAPVAEEFIFRGFLLHRFAQKWKLSIAIVVTSVIFGILHVNFFGAAVFSVVLCLVYIYTGSLWPSILLHFVNNLVSSWPSQGSQGSPSAGDLQEITVAGWVMVGIATPILFWFIKKHWPAGNAMLPYSKS